MKYIHITALCLSLASFSCAPTPAEKPEAARSTAATTGITPVSHTVTGKLEVMKFTSSGKEVIVTLQWRDYSNIIDPQVPKWYGDMGRPPAKYVVKSLTVSVDGKGIVIPEANYRYLASQWMNDVKHLGVYKSGNNLNIYVNVGDGAAGWTASYVINPAAGTLVSHQVIDGPEFHNQFAP
ncbi:hypothetical protein NT6N_18880 [Oceaniferula spumae]|uniref:DUF2271 domain-containing protein n=1 Tax=Oceaniferula spumae TaxID=2979115 RepID=A0AAT9FLL7_9BACT